MQMNYEEIRELEDIEYEVLFSKLTVGEMEKLVKDLDKFLSTSDVDNALKLVNEETFQQCFNDCCWEVITVISSHLDDTVLAKDKKLFECCESLMNIVADRCPPEEGLLQIIDQIETLNDVRFTALLKPMQKTVLRIESKLGMSVEWCFNSIHRHLESLPYPEDDDLEGEEVKLLDSHPLVRRIVDLYTSILPFYDPFVEKLTNDNSKLEAANFEHLKDAVLCSCFRLLGKPFIYLDLEYDGKTKSSARVSSEVIIGMIFKINPDLLNVLQVRNLTNLLEDLRNAKEEFRKDLEPKDTFPVENKYSAVTLAVYSYLIFSEGIRHDRIPQVYNPLFILGKNLYLSVMLLKAPATLVQRKGLCLVKSTLNRFQNYAVPDYVLESPTYRHLLEGLYIVAIYSYQKSNRQLSVTLIKELLFKFDITGRYIVLVKMVKLANHSGILGYVATLYKDVLSDVLNRPSPETSYFTEKRILYLLDNFCHLPNKAQTDLVELSDQIISSLNLIRFIVLRDSDNRTGIKEYVKVLNKGYFKHLLDGINLSRAHYKLKLEDVEWERKKRKTLNPGRSTAIIIGKNKVPNMPVDEKIMIIQSALNGFDVMESLLCRVCECIELRTPKISSVVQL